MKLWKCTAYGTDWDTTELKKGTNKEVMIERWAEELNDGYKIKVESK